VFLLPRGCRRRVLVRVVQSDAKPCVLESCPRIVFFRNESTEPISKAKGIAMGLKRLGRSAKDKKPVQTSVPAHVCLVVWLSGCPRHVSRVVVDVVRLG
jgi:hypothetical protein